MRFNKYILSILSSFLVVISCQQDLMDTQPYDSVGSGTMWTTENLCDKGVLGIYAQLRNSYVALPGAYSFERYAVSGDWRDGVDDITGGGATPSSEIFSKYWKQHYEGISRANDAIENLALTKAITENKKARLIAESKVLRAFFYYKLNMMFKGVPIYDKNESDLEVYRTRERSTEADVWDFILKDLTDAINDKNLPGKYDAGNADYGRITKGAAYALRGKVYLWTKEWHKAESDFKAIAPLGYSLYTGSGQESYKMLFKEENEQSPEMIFSVQNIAINGYGADWGRSLGNRISVRGGGWNTYMPNTDFINTYENKDGSPFNWEEEIPTWSISDSNKNMVYFLRDGLTDEEFETMKNRGADMSQYLPNGNEARIKAIFAKRDPRLDQTMITPYAQVVGSKMSRDITYTLRWPYRGADAAEPFDIRTDTNARFHYLWRKFVPESNDEYIDRLFIAIDFPIIRYADILLNLAEALNEQDKIQEATELVNLVRDRAGIALLNSNVPTTVKGQTDLRQRIQNERRWEFAGEAVNFYDEMRWKTYHLSTKFANDGGNKQIWGQKQYSYVWAGDHLYNWPIPAVERERNRNLTQNEGWSD